MRKTQILLYKFRLSRNNTYSSIYTRNAEKESVTIYRKILGDIRGKLKLVKRLMIAAENLKERARPPVIAIS